MSYGWHRIVSENSSKVRAFHVVSRECIAEVKVAGVVNKVLSGESSIAYSLFSEPQSTLRAQQFVIGKAVMYVAMAHLHI